MYRWSSTVRQSKANDDFLSDCVTTDTENIHNIHIVDNIDSSCKNSSSSSSESFTNTKSGVPVLRLGNLSGSALTSTTTKDIQEKAIVAPISVSTSTSTSTSTSAKASAASATDLSGTGESPTPDPFTELLSPSSSGKESNFQCFWNVIRTILSLAGVLVREIRTLFLALLRLLANPINYCICSCSLSPPSSSLFFSVSSIVSRIVPSSSTTSCCKRKAIRSKSAAFFTFATHATFCTCDCKAKKFRKMANILPKTITLLGVAFLIHFIIMSTFAQKEGLGISRFSPEDSQKHHYTNYHHNYHSYRNYGEGDSDLGPGSSYQTAKRLARSYRHDKHPTSSPGVGGGGVAMEPNAIPSAQSGHSRPTNRSEAVFSTDNSTTVTAQIGSKTYLPCAVKNLGSGVASWMRRKDYHLLTVGMGTYSNDDRFFVLHNRQLQSWELHIKFVKESDAGVYECQLSTHPPTSLFIHLRVVEAKAEILGEPDKHVRSGSTFELVCVLRDSTEPPVYVFWYHNDRMINYDNTRGVQVSSDAEKSILTIQEAKKSDSGNFSCVPSNARPTSISVHILNGEKPAAMQHGSRNHSSRLVPGCSMSLFFVTTAFLVFVVTSWLVTTNLSHEHNHHHHQQKRTHKEHTENLKLQSIHQSEDKKHLKFEEDDRKKRQKQKLTLKLNRDNSYLQLLAKCLKLEAEFYRSAQKSAFRINANEQGNKGQMMQYENIDFDFNDLTKENETRFMTLIILLMITLSMTQCRENEQVKVLKVSRKAMPEENEKSKRNQNPSPIQMCSTSTSSSLISLVSPASTKADHTGHFFARAEKTKEKVFFSTIVPQLQLSLSSSLSFPSHPVSCCTMTFVLVSERFLENKACAQQLSILSHNYYYYYYYYYDCNNNGSPEVGPQIISITIIKLTVEEKYSVVVPVAVQAATQTQTPKKKESPESRELEKVISKTCFSRNSPNPSSFPLVTSSSASDSTATLTPSSEESCSGRRNVTSVSTTVSSSTSSPSQPLFSFSISTKTKMEGECLRLPRNNHHQQKRRLEEQGTTKMGENVPTTITRLHNATGNSCRESDFYCRDLPKPSSSSSTKFSVAVEAIPSESESQFPFFSNQQVRRKCGESVKVATR